MCKLTSILSCPSVSINHFVLIQINVFIFNQINSQFFKLSTWQFHSGHKYQISHFHLLDKSQGTGIKALFLYGWYMTTCLGEFAAMLMPIKTFARCAGCQLPQLWDRNLTNTFCRPLLCPECLPLGNDPSIKKGLAPIKWHTGHNSVSSEAKRDSALDWFHLALAYDIICLFVCLSETWEHVNCSNLNGFSPSWPGCQLRTGSPII